MRWHLLIVCYILLLKNILCMNKTIFEELLGSPVVKTLPLNAGGMGLIPSQRAKIPKIPHASG